MFQKKKSCSKNRKSCHFVQKSVQKCNRTSNTQKRAERSKSLHASFRMLFACTCTCATTNCMCTCGHTPLQPTLWHTVHTIVGRQQLDEIENPFWDLAKINEKQCPDLMLLQPCLHETCMNTKEHSSMKILLVWPHTVI